MSSRFAVTLRCTACNHRYKRIMSAADADALALLTDPPCPKCSKPQAVPRGMDFTTGTAPAIGGSLVVKARDYTEQATAQDYGMTDINLNIREGDSAAPKLPPKLQDAADNMFTRRPMSRGTPRGSILNIPQNAVLASAVGGRFMTPDTANPVAMMAHAKARPPVRFIAGDGIRGGA
jgi:hypothetical protein